MSRIKRLILEIHRRSLWQVLALYALGSWAVFQVIGSLYEWLGLPDWVPGTALIILLIGLPLVLATAFVQEGGPRVGGEAEAPAGSVETDVPEGAPPSRRTRPQVLTWNRVITAAVLAFALLGLAATGFMGMRLLGIGPVGTLVAKGVLSPNDRIVMADFQGTGGGEEYAAAVRTALRSDLETSPVVELLDDGERERALRRMEVDPAEPLTPELARELAVREGLKATLEGELAGLGGSWVITARLMAPGTGEHLAAFRETADGEDEMIDAVDRLGRSIREKIGETLSSVRAGEPLEQVTTSSLEALRLYAEAVDLYSFKGDFYGATMLLERALEVDSTFAMAWRKLGMALRAASSQPTRRMEALTRAFEMRHRLTDRERLITEGTYYTETGDHERAIRAYRTLLDRYPANSTGNVNLAYVLRSADREEEALAVIEHAMGLGLDSPTLHTHRVGALWFLGRKNEARAALDTAAARHPESASVRRLQLEIAAASRDHERADSLLRVIEDLLPDEGWATTLKFLYRNWIEAVQGHLRTVRARFDEAGPEVPARLHREALITTASMSTLWAIQLGDQRAAGELLQKALEWFPLDGIPAADRPYLALASAYAYAGAPDRGRDMLDRWQALEGRSATELPIIPALLLMHSDPDSAAERLRADSCTTLFCLGDEAEIMIRAGRADSALTLYTRFVEGDNLYRASADCVFLPVAYERLAQLHEERGNREQAVEYYARFAELWKDADPELQPRVEAARQALARLTREGA